MTDEERDTFDAAEELMQDKAFNWAVMKLRKQWYAEMMALEPTCSSPGYLTALARYASMLAALESIPLELSLFIKNYKLDKRRA